MTKREKSDKPVTILAFDPGGTTGVAIVHYVPATDKATSLWTTELKWPYDFYNLNIVSPDKNKPIEVVVAEDFIIKKMLFGDKCFALRVLGALRYIYQDSLILQQPAEKTRVNDRMLHKYSLQNSSLHIDDAYRHCLIWAQKNCIFGSQWL